MYNVDHIAIRVSDLDLAQQWYEQNLGAKLEFKDQYYRRMLLNNTTLALIDENMPVIALAPESEIAEKLASNLEEVKARGGTLYVFSDPSMSMDLESGRLINMPKCDFLLTPIIYTIPLQILSYEVALLRGTDIDQPRNLAKSVTVE